MVKIFLLSSLINNLGLWILLRMAVEPSALPIILHYQAALGPDLLGSWKGVFALPLVGLLIIMINLILIYFIFNKRYKFILASTSLLAQIILTIGAIVIIIIN